MHRTFFLYISLTSLHDFDVKLTSFMFYGQRELFSFLTWIFLFRPRRFRLRCHRCILHFLILTVTQAKSSTLLKGEKKQSGNYFLNKYFLLCLHFRTYSLTNSPKERCCHLSSSVPVSVASGLVNWEKKRLGLFILETLTCPLLGNSLSIKLLVVQISNPNTQKSVQCPFSCNF